MALRRLLKSTSTPAGIFSRPSRPPAPSSAVHTTNAVVARGFRSTSRRCLPPTQQHRVSTAGAVGVLECSKIDARSPRHQHAMRTQARWHGGGPGPDTPTINITFLSHDDDVDGGGRVYKARIGEVLLRVAQRVGEDLEGACEGVCACSTCHVVVTPKFYSELEDHGHEPSEDEEDMLDMAAGLTEYSRLGCQIVAEEWMDGAKVTLPRMTRNFYVDGHVPVPH